MPTGKVLPDAVADRLRAIVPIVEIEIEVVGLEAEHGAERRGVGRKAPVRAEDVIAAGDGRLDGPLAGRAGAFRHGARILPGAVAGALAVGTVLSELLLDHGADRRL